MHKKILMSLFSIILCLYSCSSNKQNASFYTKINEYNNYQDMVCAENIFYEKYKDEENDLFNLNNLNIDFLTIKYFIGGICYCPLENNEKKQHCESEINCQYLRNRELFIEYYLNDGNVVTLIYKNLINDKMLPFNWIESNGENCYRYETNVNEEYSYILEDSNNNHLCGLKMLNKDDDIKLLFFDSIISNIN